MKRIIVIGFVMGWLGVCGPAQAATPAETVAQLMGKVEAGTALTAEEHQQLVQALDAVIASAELTQAQVIGLVQSSHRVLSAEEKAAVGTKMLARLAGSQEKAAALSVKEAYEATIMFDQLGGAAEKSKMVVAWMGAAETWKTAGPWPLVRALWALDAGKAEDVAQLKTAWVSHVWTTYLSAQADPAKATGPEYAELAIQTHRMLSAEQQKELAASMVPRLSKAETAVQLSMEDIKKARQTLSSLRNHLDAADVMAAWVNGCEKYKQVAPADLGYLCDWLRLKAGLAGPKAAIAKIVEHARSAKLFSDTQEILKGDVNGWVTMARGLRYYMTPSDQVAASGQLRALFVQDKSRTQQLTPAQLNQLVGTAREFGLRDEAGEILVAWMAANNWSTLKSEQLAAVTECFGLAGGSDAAKAQLADLLWRDYLSNEQFLAQTPLAELTGFVSNVRSVLSADQKTHVANKLTQRFAADAGALAKLKVGDAVALAGALRAMDKAAQAADTVVRWIAACDAWKQAGTYDQEVLAGVLKAGETEDSREKAVQWALKVYSEKLASLKPTEQPETFTLARLASFMQSMGLTGKGKGYPEYAAALAAALKAGAKAGPRSQCYQLALPLGSAEVRQVLLAELVQEDGRPRREVGKVLAPAYKKYDSADGWRQLLDGKLADPNVGGDAKAGWLLMRAEVAATAKQRGGYREQALATAVSWAAKLEAVRDIVNGYCHAGKHDEGLAYLDSVAAQFTEAEAKLAIEDLRNEARLHKSASLEEDATDLLGSAKFLEQRARKAEASGKLKECDKLLQLRDRLQKQAAHLRANAGN